MKLSQSPLPAWKIQWLNPEAKGSVDFLPDYSESLADGGIHYHATTVSRSKIFSAFVASGDPSSFVFSYGGICAPLNEKTGVYRGDVKLNYNKIEGASELFWREEDGEWIALPVKVSKISAEEGEKREYSSRSIVRSKSLSEIYRHALSSQGELECAACGFKGLAEYGEAKKSCLEVHHKYPLNEGMAKTTLDDLILLCANCHRTIHALGDEPIEKFLRRFEKAIKPKSIR